MFFLNVKLEFHGSRPGTCYSQLGEISAKDQWKSATRNAILLDYPLHMICARGNNRGSKGISRELKDDASEDSEEYMRVHEHCLTICCPTGRNISLWHWTLISGKVFGYSLFGT